MTASALAGSFGSAVHGAVADELVDVADAEGADIIVVGWAGLGDGSRLLPGGVTERLIHLASRPVLVVL
jgi:nucleotide-binding universal stress UspA family protein